MNYQSLKKLIKQLIIFTKKFKIKQNILEINIDDIDII